jgi:hypothetical protein
MVASDDTLSAREKVEFIETGHMPTVPAKEKPTKLDLLKQAEEWKKSDDPEMRAAGESFINANAPKPTNMKEEWVMRPGSDKPERAFVDPKKPGGYFDVNNQPLPEGTQAVATPVQQRMYGAVQGYYYYFLGQGLSDKEAREKAGAMFVEREGVHLGRVEQQAAIDSALSGVGLGPGFSSAAKSGGAPAAKTSTSPVSSIPSTPKATTPKNPARPEGPSQEDTDNINIYLSSLFGNTKSTNKASQVRQQAGMKALAKASGLSPTEFQTAAAVAQDKVKALGETVERYGAMVRLTDVMDVVGDTVIDTAKKAIKSDSPLANQAWRTIELKSVGDPATREFLLTLNDFARHYATLTAGGALSRAMLPVSVKDDVDNLISPNMTLKEAVAVVDRIKKQAKSEKQGYQNAIKDLGGEIKSSLPGPSPKNKLEPPSGAPTDLKGKSTEELLKMLGGGGAG